MSSRRDKWLCRRNNRRSKSAELQPCGPSQYNTFAAVGGVVIWRGTFHTLGRIRRRSCDRPEGVDGLGSWTELMAVGARMSLKRYQAAFSSRRSAISVLREDLHVKSFSLTPGLCCWKYRSFLGAGVREYDCSGLCLLLALALRHLNYIFSRSYHRS